MNKNSIIVLTWSVLLLSCSLAFAQHASKNSEASICRIWHGWTTKQNADRFESIIQEVAQGLKKEIPQGFQGIQLLRNDKENEVEFTTIMWFDSLEAVKRLAGEQYEHAHIDEKIRPLLLRYDQKSSHANVKYSLLLSLH